MNKYVISFLILAVANVVLVLSIGFVAVTLTAATKKFGINAWNEIKSADGAYAFALPFKSMERYHPSTPDLEKFYRFKTKLNFEQMATAINKAKSGYSAELVDTDKAKEVFAEKYNKGIKISVKHKTGTAYYFITDYIHDGKYFTIYTLTADEWGEYFH